MVKSSNQTGSNRRPALCTPVYHLYCCCVKVVGGGGGGVKQCTRITCQTRTRTSVLIQPFCNGNLHGSWSINFKNRSSYCKIVGTACGCGNSSNNIDSILLKLDLELVLSSSNVLLLLVVVVLVVLVVVGGGVPCN